MVLIVYKWIVYNCRRRLLDMIKLEISEFNGVRKQIVLLIPIIKLREMGLVTLHNFRVLC